jgi:hypothetical protein
MKKIVILSILFLSFVSCISTRGYQGDTTRDININKLALMINDSLRKPALKNKEIGILSFANLNNLEIVEPLGRHLQEKLFHALFELGFRIIEIRLGDHIYFTPLVGELNLTRLKEKLKNTEFKEIKSLIVGTYIDAGDYVYVNSKLVELDNNLVRASGEMKIRKGEYLYKLLKLENETQGYNVNTEVYERFPPASKKTKKK